ncbi:nicotinamide mononucleotide transporter, partial [Coprococcus eutactus]|uniref:nicotinamide mononucleotide transporter n=1 Tax=Coprococcus eutactus TaxID=33043 RepID=UPI00210B7891
DAFTTVSSVVEMVVSVRMFAEQSWIWIVVDVFTIYMWARYFMSGNDNIATLLMWKVYLGNAVIMCLRWEREVTRNRLD